MCYYWVLVLLFSNENKTCNVIHIIFLLMSCNIYISFNWKRRSQAYTELHLSLLRKRNTQISN